MNVSEFFMLKVICDMNDIDESNENIEPLN